MRYRVEVLAPAAQMRADSTSLWREDGWRSAVVVVDRDEAVALADKYEDQRLRARVREE